ncbi:conserved hypothetical protein [Ricinus communis]|uniref:Uncharacterized protein n=1 Tax=Ricinus communis TaxID=3988 RepID=B9SQZ8_RICCO|nr:conserved hypothetical protein [Ricinus communis]
MASKNIIGELNKGEKLNGNNYNILHLKMHYVLEEQEILEAINNHRRNMATYTSWKKKDSLVRGILINSISDNLVHKYQQYPIAHAMWVALRESFEGLLSSNLDN